MSYLFRSQFPYKPPIHSLCRVSRIDKQVENIYTKYKNNPLLRGGYYAFICFCYPLAS